MRWECAAPLWAWCCCARGMNCGRRWGKAARWPREGPRERNRSTIARRWHEASRRNELLDVYRAATGPHARARGVRAYAGVRGVPYAAARAGARIAAADAGDAGGRGGAAGTAGPLSRTGAQVHAMDLDDSAGVGGYGSLCAVYRIRGTVADATGTSGIWRVESFEFADFSRRLLERMAIDDHFVGGARAGNRGGLRGGVLEEEGTARVGAGRGAGGILRRAAVSAGVGAGHRDAQRRIRGGPQRRDHQRRYFPIWRTGARGRHGGGRRIYFWKRRHCERARERRRDRLRKISADQWNCGWKYPPDHEYLDHPRNGGQ